MQWWGALTQQFTEIATKAMQDSSALTARNLAAAGTATAATKKSGTAAPAKSTAARPARKRKA
jgi:hypothetical protein